MRILMTFALAACGCQAVQERAFSPVTDELRLANAQLADGVGRVERGVVKLTEVDVKLTESNDRMARMEAQLKATDERLGRVEGQLAGTDKRIAGVQGDVATATKTVARVDATTTDVGATVKGMAATLADANKKVDETNKKLDVVVEAAKKLPGVAPKKE